MNQFKQIIAIGISWVFLLALSSNCLLAQTYNPKQRSIRTGKSVNALMANALQTMDFGIDVLTKNLKTTNYREDKTIIPWEQTIEKYMGLWENTMAEISGKIRKRKGNLDSHQEMKRGYDLFFADVFAEGYRLLHWKWKLEIKRVLLDYDIDDLPKIRAGYQEMIRNANDLLKKAEQRSSRSDASSAVNLAEKVSDSMVALHKFIRKTRKAKLTSLDSKISAVKSKLSAVSSKYSNQMNRWTEKISGWAKLIDTYWKKYQATWKTWESIAQQFEKSGLFDDYSYFKGAKYTQLKQIAEAVRDRL